MSGGIFRVEINRLQARVAELETVCARLEAELEQTWRLDMRRALSAIEASQVRITALEDTIDLERAINLNTLTHTAGSPRYISATNTIAEIESRRGVGWNGAR